MIDITMLFIYRSIRLSASPLFYYKLSDMSSFRCLCDKPVSEYW